MKKQTITNLLVFGVLMSVVILLSAELTRKLSRGAPNNDPYADNVVDYQIYGTSNTHTDPNTVLGPPCTPGDDLSLGGGWVMVDMGLGEEVIDGLGEDLRVYESAPGCNGGLAEPYEVFVSGSPDGPWTSIGNGKGASSFDLAPSGLTSVRYVRVEDRSSGQPDNGSPTPGADIDAFELLHYDFDLALVERFAPYLRYHWYDVYQPISVTVPLEWATLFSESHGHELISPTLQDLASEEWRQDEHAYIDLLGKGPQEIQNVYQSTIRPKVSLQAFARVDRNHSSGKIAIQYWLFYYDNPWKNHHEGDWEMVQVVLDANETPLYAAYAQHEGGSKRLWKYVEKVDGEHPIVYAARGSHASYFKPYDYFQISGTDNTSPFKELGILSVEMLPPFPDDQNTWLYFEGHWGGKGSWWVLDQDGPTGPSQKGKKWQDPVAWSEGSWSFLPIVGVPWDEFAHHNTLGKFFVSVPTPLDVHVYKLPWMQHVGWKDGEEETEIPSSEYFDNPLAGIGGMRTIILHDVPPTSPFPESEYLVIPRYRPPSTYQMSAQAVSEPMTMTLRFPDFEASTMITSTYVLTQSWNVSSTGVISVYHGSDLHLMVDIDGNGEFDQDIPPTTLDEAPVDFTPPAPITDLAVLTSATDAAVLTWTAPGDDESIGTAAAYDVRYYTVPLTDANWVSATLAISPPLPSLAGTTEVFTLTGLPGGRYYFALESIDDVMHYSGMSNVVQAQIPHHLYLPVILRNG